ncbi:MAG: FAD-binding protein [Pleurocapsa minor GSE-CHR-MK-17-07R]|nr:FAD-binding protein [Pleurocapsa minor GSE-CHR-MK 17-07R]
MSDYRTNVCNVLVIGSGGAGYRAAISAYQAGCEVVVLGKRLRKDAHTVLAAGGINAALGTVDPEDSWQQHFADTFRDGYLLNNAAMVEIMAREAGSAVLELADWGCDFARLPDGRLDQRFFGAHKYRRTCYAGDYTGRAILHTLADKAEELKLPVHENKYVTQLLVHDGACFGALAFDIHTGERTVYLADAVILAAGGHTRLWRRSSSRRDENTGDGMYLALQAGLELADMELVQFHPTGMVAPEDMAGTLVTEAVRGEGGILRNSLGERYMEKYDPARKELSTRDRVALANYTEIIEGRGTANGAVYLDISHRPKDYILKKLPRMYRQFMESQMLDISQKPMEVAPTAHYSMGGVVVDPETTETAVRGLFAAGEVSAGLHGANRLGGNSLVETLVFGRRAGENAAAYSNGIDVQIRSKDVIRRANDDLSGMIREGGELARPLQRAVRNTMWENCGVVRDEDRLKQGLARLAELREAAKTVDVRPSSEGWQDLALALDLRASIASAEATIRSAIERRESRGAQQRYDYPDLSPDLMVNFRIRMDENGNQTLSSVPVPEIPAELQEWVEEDPQLALNGRLLE